MNIDYDNVSAADIINSILKEIDDLQRKNNDKIKKQKDGKPKFLDKVLFNPKLKEENKCLAEIHGELVDLNVLRNSYFNLSPGVETQILRLGDLLSVEEKAKLFALVNESLRQDKLGKKIDSTINNIMEKFQKLHLKNKRFKISDAQLVADFKGYDSLKNALDQLRAKCKIGPKRLRASSRNNAENKLSVNDELKTSCESLADMLAKEEQKHLEDVLENISKTLVSLDGVSIDFTKIIDYLKFLERKYKKELVEVEDRLENRSKDRSEDCSKDQSKDQSKDRSEDRSEERTNNNLRDYLRRRAIVMANGKNSLQEGIVDLDAKNEISNQKGEPKR